MKTNRLFNLMLFMLLIGGSMRAQFVRTTEIFIEDFNNTTSFGNTYTMEALSDGTDIDFFVRSIVAGRTNDYVINTELNKLRSGGIDDLPDNHDGSKAISFADLVGAYSQATRFDDVNFDEGLAIVTESIDISSFQDLNIGLKVASTNGDRNRYAEDDGLDIQYELDNSGVWETVGRFRGRGVSSSFTFPNEYFYEDDDLDGVADVQTGPDFREVLYSVDERAGTAIRGNTIRLRVAFYSASEAEGSFDDLILTGSRIPPSITFVNTSDESCNNSRDGAATASVKFGQPPYNYVWSMSSNTATLRTNDTTNTETGIRAGTYTLKVTDANGDSDEKSFTIGTTPDVENPMFSGVIPDVVLDADGACSTTLESYIFMARSEFSDNCDNFLAITQTPVSGTIVSGTTLITLTAADDAGNTTSTTFNVTVLDEEKPVVEAISDQVQDSGSSCSVALADYKGLVVVTDNCDSSPVISQSPAPGTLLSRPRETTVTMSVTDASGNTTEVTFVVETEDNIDPIIECPENILIESRDELIVNYDNPIVTDNCTDSEDIDLELILGLESGSTYPFGTTTHTILATDRFGNIGSCSFDVTLDKITGINDELETSQLFFPNPSKGVLSFSGEAPDKIIIKNLNGIIVTEIDQIQNPVTLEFLPSNVYLLEVHTNEKVEFHKVSIIK